MLLISFLITFPNYLKKFLTKNIKFFLFSKKFRLENKKNMLIFHYENFIISNNQKLLNYCTKNNKIDIKIFKFLYQYFYKYYLTLYYLNKKEGFKTLFVLARIINKLICSYANLENKNFLRNYDTSLIKYFELFESNHAFFYKNNYIKTYNDTKK